MTLVWFLRSGMVSDDTPGGSLSFPRRAGWFPEIEWSDNSPRLLAEGHFLAFVVDTNHSGTLHSPAQSRLNLAATIFSLFTRRISRVALSERMDLRIQSRFIAAVVGDVGDADSMARLCRMLFWCMANWWLLATIYFLPVWFGGFFANRDLNFRQSWKLAGAALMPGALVMILVIVFYGFGVLDLVQLAAGVGAHFLVSWVYLVWSVWASPKLVTSAAPSENPFTGKAACDQ